MGERRISSNNQGAAATATEVVLVSGVDGSFVGASPPSTGTQSSVVSANSDTTILAANAARKGATIYNDSTAVLYLLLAAGTSSNTAYTKQLAAGASYDLPVIDGGVYTGIIKGIWASQNGNARVTEFT